MSAIDLVTPGSLDGVRVGLSVSDSADLGRLGLSARHAELAVGELARAVLIAGGTLVYGGRIKPSGYTQFLMHEVRRYGSAGRLLVCLAEPEHAKLSRAELDAVDRDLGALGRVVCLDRDGTELPDLWRLKPDDARPIDDANARRNAYSALRRYMTSQSHARVVLGGQLTGFEGRQPGVVEEASLALQAGQPLYVAAGFGGAAALIAIALQLDGIGWLPPSLPAVEEGDARGWREQIASAASAGGVGHGSDGLDPAERAGLTSTHRAGEVASYVVRGLSREANRLRGT